MCVNVCVYIQCIYHEMDNLSVMDKMNCPNVSMFHYLYVSVICVCGLFASCEALGEGTDSRDGKPPTALLSAHIPH